MQFQTFLKQNLSEIMQTVSQARFQAVFTSNRPWERGRLMTAFILIHKVLSVSVEEWHLLQDVYFLGRLRSVLSMILNQGDGFGLILCATTCETDQLRKNNERPRQRFVDQCKAGKRKIH